MIGFDDLLAARVVYRQRPDLRRALAEGLRTLQGHAEGAGFESLLGNLVKQGHLTREQAEQAYGLVRQARSGPALGIFAQMLVLEGGQSREVLEGLVRGLGAEADCDRLREAVVAKGLLEDAAADRIRFRARQVFDCYKARQISEYQGRHQAETASTLVGGTVAGEDTETALGKAEVPSGVYRMELVLPDAAEATGIIELSTVDLTPPLDVLAPRFPVPEWIDTSDGMVGRGVGEYRILGRIGAGAMGSVYLADHADRHTPIALKLLPQGASRERRERFKREILANGFFSHENVIDVYDAGETRKGQFYLAMEFFDGGDLDSVLESEGSVSLRQTLTLSRQVLLALQAAHRAGIVHRDVKPANILVSSGASVTKLMDFGIALLKDLGEFRDKVFESDSGGVTGTPEYLSPEQAFRDPVGPAADLYSLGMVIYRLLAGRLPFQSESVSGWITSHMLEDPLPLSEAAPSLDVPPRLTRLLDRMFIKKPTERIQTAAEVLEELDAVALELGGGERRSRLFSKFRRGF